MAGEREANPRPSTFVSFLSDLEETEPQEERLRMFEIRMLSLFGYRPNLKRCDLCKKDWEDLKEAPSVFFSLEKGALVCERCSKTWNNLIPLSLGTARLIEKDLPDGIGEDSQTEVHLPGSLGEPRASSQIYYLSTGKGVEVAESTEDPAIQSPF